MQVILPFCMQTGYIAHKKKVNAVSGWGCVCYIYSFVGKL